MVPKRPPPTIISQQNHVEEAKEGEHFLDVYDIGREVSSMQQMNEILSPTRAQTNIKISLILLFLLSLLNFFLARKWCILYSYGCNS